MDDLPEEPPNWTALYWPEDVDDLAVLAIRDDVAGRALGDSPEHRWFRPNVDARPWTWATLVEGINERGLSLSAAVQLGPLPEHRLRSAARALVADLKAQHGQARADVEQARADLAEVRDVLDAPPSGHP